MTLAIVPGLVVSSANERFIVPQASLLELVWLEGEKARTQIELIGGTPVFRRCDHLLPLLRLSEILKLPSTAPDTSDAVNTVILQAEERQFGLVVDGISDTQEIVVKPLGGLLKSIKVYAGAIINQISDISNTIACAVEEQTATTNEIGRNVSDAARGTGEIATNISGVAMAAQSTTKARCKHRPPRKN